MSKDLGGVTEAVARATERLVRLCSHSGRYDAQQVTAGHDLTFGDLRAIAAYQAAAPAPQPIETAPRTPADLSETLDFLGWCPDETAPKGGDWRVVWWEPKMGDGCWFGDRDLEEHPTLWLPLPLTPEAAASDQVKP